MYFYNKSEGKCTDLDKYKFKYEDSVQQILGENSQILLAINELNIPPYDGNVSIREYPTARGPVDIVYITDNGDIILVETKLLKNPESHRTVVAQAIDYAKAFSEEDINSIKNKINNKNKDYSLLQNNKDFESILNKNLLNGNYQVLIVGDEIHPNILGMVESIQSAPHLAFTLSAISLNPFLLDGNVILFPKIESKTVEIERSVISIEILKNNEVKIDSSSPEKESKGNKPKTTEEEYIKSLEKPEFLNSLKHLWKEMKRMGGTIDWGTLGFSGGYRINNKRISLIWGYGRWINILTRKVRNNYTNITDKQYNKYLEKLRESEYIYENIIVPNKSEVHFEYISVEDFEIVIDATLLLMKEMMDKENKSI